jgi:hypothetical protein
MILPLLVNIPGLNLHLNNSVSMQERILASIPDLTYIETLAFQCRKESWGRAQGQCDRVLANAASNATGRSTQTKG